MSKFENLNLAEIVRYIPAVLQEQKGSDWRIVYYAMHPQSKQLKMVRIRVNKIKNAYRKKSEARQQIAEMIQHINAKLSGGWSPFFEGENSRLYTQLSEVCTLFIEEKKRELRENTLRSYISFCKMLTEWADKHAPKIYCSLFSKNYAVRYMDYMYNERKVSAVTYNNHRKLGSAFFMWAVEKCYTNQNPFEGIRMKRSEDKKRTIIPPDVRQYISEYLEQTNLGYLLVCNLTYSSLIRPKEIAHIQFENIHLDKKFITIPASVAKNHKQRHAAMSNQTIELLQRYIGIEKYPHDWYPFSGNKISLGGIQPSETPAYSGLYTKEWLDLRKKLKIPKEMQLYSFRDTGIFEMLKSGIDDLSVMQHADHSDLSITTRYANHFDPHLVEKINRLVPDF